ncbi:MAG TPA: excinuclease ABC subunit UvrB, partial [Candidatus Latescibacteria bacterium]|nr:excinuclease ABC subunit UvrB [Candidatus Latescibacterota bacterium]
MAKFKLVSLYEPTGDQPQAIEKLVDGVLKGYRYQTLLGVTGSGKTFTVAHVIARIAKPTLVISHNKTLAAQLYGELKALFPENAVEYFISYYDYYQPEAYIPQTDTYIEKEVDINEEIDRLRLRATSALLEREDVIVVASVSCIYGIGSPQEVKKRYVVVERGQELGRDVFLRRLVDIYYTRNDISPERGTFRARGDVVEVVPAYGERVLRVEFWGDQVEGIQELDPLTRKVVAEKERVAIYPAKHFLVPPERIEEAIEQILQEMEERVAWFRAQGKFLEAQRLETRTRYDMELLRETGYCPGIENYSRYLSGRRLGERPATLLDYFPEGFLTVIDESHVTVPQLRGMYAGDRSRKEVLIEHGFRLPSALDNRPLFFEEFEALVDQVIFVSATPGPYELEKSKGRVVEQIIRPTGLVDPEVEVRPAEGQVDDLLEEVRRRAERGERSLVTTLTKKMAEDLAEYMATMGLRVRYLHSEIEALERM